MEMRPTTLTDGDKENMYHLEIGCGDLSLKDSEFAIQQLKTIDLRVSRDFVRNMLKDLLIPKMGCNWLINC